MNRDPSFLSVMRLRMRQAIGSVTPRLHNCVSSVVIILAVCVYSSANPNVRSSTVTETIRPFGSLLSLDGVIADLDGDHKPDLAQSRQIGHFENGYLYRIDLKLSSRSISGSLTFKHTDALGLTIIPVDVDGDHDLDLAVTGRFVGQSIGVWINDGTGIFSQGSVSLYSASFGRLLLEFDQPQIPNPAVQPPPSRHLTEGVTSTQGGAGHGDSGAQTFHLAPVYRFVEFQPGSAHLRAPPRSASL